MAIFVAPPSMGLGDLIVTLPVVHSLIAQGKEVVLVVRAEPHAGLASRIDGLGAIVLDWEASRWMKEKDVFLDLRDHPLQRAAWWGSPDFSRMYPGWTINDIIAKICSDKGFSIDVRRVEPLPSKARTDIHGVVLFVPGSALSSKHWSQDSWLYLATKLKEAGQRIMVVGEPSRSTAVRDLVNAGLEWEPTPTLADAIDVVSSAAAVVSVDTGLMHLAVHQGIPTVGMFKRNAVYVRDFKHFIPLTATKNCKAACNAAERECADLDRPIAGPQFQFADWSCKAAAGSSCMDTVSPESVLSALSSVAPHVVPRNNPTLCDRASKPVLERRAPARHFRSREL